VPNCKKLRFAAQFIVLSLIVLLFLCSSTIASGYLSAKNVTLVSHLDMDGGGMVDVQGNLAAIGHMGPPYATSILDISDPTNPYVISKIKAYPGTHSHKARLCGNTLVINVEQYGGGDGRVGLAFFDISNPLTPKETALFAMGGAGAHRFQLDCPRKLVYTSGSADGFQGNITMIIDIADPTHPREIGRWWFPGQHIAGGETSMQGGGSIKTHHPLRLGDRLYVSLWFGGFALLDITDITKPRLISHVNYHNGDSSPTHTTLPVGHKIMGKDLLIVFDEELSGGNPPAFMRVFDITDEKKPKQVGTFHAQRDESGKTGGRFGAHQPHEHVGRDNLVYAAWFSGGLRVIDVSNPNKPEEVGHYVPKAGKGDRFAQSNDVFVDHRGLIYLIDRYRGLDILQYTGSKKP
jgi:hypothetical protein